jgi:hypothetical protein
MLRESPLVSVDGTEDWAAFELQVFTGCRFVDHGIVEKRRMLIATFRWSTSLSGMIWLGAGGAHDVRVVVADGVFGLPFFVDVCKLNSSSDATGCAFCREVLRVSLELSQSALKVAVEPLCLALLVVLLDARRQSARAEAFEARPMMVVS